RIKAAAPQRVSCCNLLLHPRLAGKMTCAELANADTACYTCAQFIGIIDRSRRKPGISRQKLVYMWDHPSHFPLAMWRAMSGWWHRLWQELIGILGWQDVLLQSWTYIILTGLLVLVPFQKLQLDGRTRVII